MSRFGGPTLAAGATADVTLLLEGTYPFVSGGVSSWVHQIIRGLPELSFSIVFLGGAVERYERLRYTLPDNVVHLEEHFLSEPPPPGSGRPRGGGDAAFFDQSAAVHDALRDHVDAATLAAALDGLVGSLLSAPAQREREFLHAERAWTDITGRYEAGSPRLSFLEYFWTVRSMHAPLFLVARAAARVPPSRVFHVVSTGFAGFLGVLLRRARARPLVLTEHGIYTKERRIELLQAHWIRDDSTGGDGPVGHLRQLWIRFFEALGKMTYDAADPVLSLYEGNRARQIEDGATPARTRVVPNGIEVERFRPLRAQRTEKVPHVLGLVGRVVPIKDIKTFVRALRVVCSEVQDAEGWVVGPDDEDPAYAEECRQLVATLGLEGRVRFLGFQRPEDVFPKLGLNVLTSISEAQPLVVLEGFACGVPCVASDVGCCRELVEGVAGEDRALGAAGAIVGIADPAGTARAAIGLLRDEARWRDAQRAGIARVERAYTQASMLERYRAVYRQALDRGSPEGT
ncbi:MAG TPA: GT4 family glycosyltransferase PelF [Polyangiaceae bacterium]|jgi:glycosyltransferase involved in cell wall biosynthesis